jgi:hypothetical protein
MPPNDYSDLSCWHCHDLENCFTTCKPTKRYIYSRAIGDSPIHQPFLNQQELFESPLARSHQKLDSTVISIYTGQSPISCAIFGTVARYVGFLSGWWGRPSLRTPNMSRKLTNLCPCLQGLCTNRTMCSFQNIYSAVMNVLCRARSVECRGTLTRDAMQRRQTSAATFWHQHHLTRNTERRLCHATNPLILDQTFGSPR